MNCRIYQSINSGLLCIFASALMAVICHTANGQSTYYDFEGRTVSPAYNTLIEITASVAQPAITPDMSCS
jgi:hypothetical protein